MCTAGIFAIAASGLVLTYTTTGIFNFAHGAIGMLGAFTYWQLHVALGLADAGRRSSRAARASRRCSASRSKLGIMRRLQGTSEATQLVVSVSLLAAALGLAAVALEPAGVAPASTLLGGQQDLDRP